MQNQQPEKNGYVKWPQLVTVAVSILGIIVTISLFAIREVAAVDLRGNARFLDNRTMIAAMLKENSADHELIKCQLTEIRTQLKYLIKEK